MLPEYYEYDSEFGHTGTRTNSLVTRYRTRELVYQYQYHDIITLNMIQSTKTFDKIVVRS